MEILMLILVLVLTMVVIFGVSYYINTLQIQSKPDEWLLVIRNGKPVQMGVGITTYKKWGDQVVKFPSKIHQVDFSALQTTSEKQGIEVNGVIIWSIYRDEDGPLKAYKALGQDLNQKIPKKTYKTLQLMANSIIRHKIANSTIEDILTKREEIRQEMKNELNKILNGWGVWLESVEITDVKISSRKLFENMQVEFRENQRINAEMIKMESDKQIQFERSKKATQMKKLRSEADKNKKVYEMKENFKVEQQQIEYQRKKNEIRKKQIDQENQMKKHEKQAKIEYEKYERDLNNKRAFKKIDMDKEVVQKNIELDVIKQKLKMQDQIKQNEHQIELEKQRLELQKLEQKQSNEIFDKLSPLNKELKTIERIYSNLPIETMKIVNMTSTDPIGEMVTKLRTYVSSIQVEQKNQEIY